MQLCSEMVALKLWMLVSSNIIYVKMASNMKNKDKPYSLLLFAVVLASCDIHFF